MLKQSKRAQLNVLTGIAMGIITIAVLIGIGLVILQNLTSAVGCGADTYNATSGACNNASGAAVALNDAGTSIAYGMTQIGSTGLLTWLPALIALIIGVFFLTYFMGGKKKY